MTDAEIVASAREAELRALFAILHRGVAGLDADAACNFIQGLDTLAQAEAIALKAIAKRGVA